MRAVACGLGITLVAVVAPSFGTAQAASGESPTLPQAIPIFPLQDVVLFPHGRAPLHIFEPRYRAMVADALAGDGIIGMALLAPGYEADYEGRPPVFAIGSAGVIVRSEALPDGRYNIVLQGFTKFRILGEDQRRPYRLAEVEEIPDTIAESDRGLLGLRRQQLEEALLAAFPQAQRPPADVPDEEVIDGLSILLPLEPAQRQQLLEADGPLRRAAGLVAILRGGLRTAVGGLRGPDSSSALGFTALREHP